MTQQRGESVIAFGGDDNRHAVARGEDFHLLGYVVRAGRHAPPHTQREGSADRSMCFYLTTRRTRSIGSEF